MKMNYLDELNAEQKKAVTHMDGPLLIIAGAGAGKTKTLTYRVYHLIKQGVSPDEILAITFTNKSAREMGDRISGIIANDATLNNHGGHFKKPFVSTFHTLGVNIIKENAEYFGITRHFTIYDRDDSLRAIRESLKLAGFDPKQFAPKKLLGAISRRKGNSETLEKFKNAVGNNYFDKIVEAVWTQYELFLKNEKSLDFDDLLLKTAELLKKDKDVRLLYQNRWKYIHIDEYQDTNKVQYDIVSLLLGQHKNLCVVGDSDQTIYSWRGANIHNILNFEKDYPNAITVTLEENYRSTKNILSVANDVIKKNELRKEKTLFTNNNVGDKITLYSAYDENDESAFIAKEIASLIKSKHSPREIALLYRANFQSRVLEEALLNANIPYQVLGVRFYERKEIKDVLSYIRSALNPDSLNDIKRVINVPARGIGKITMLKIFSHQLESLSSAMQKKVQDFYDIISDIKSVINVKKPSDLIKYTLERSGLKTALEKGDDDDQDRLSNIKELVTLALKYDTLPLPEGLEKMLEDAVLASDQDSLIKNEQAVKLLTVHAAKGLEFDTVFVSGLEEGLFPHYSHAGDDTKSPEEMEEERRLFYVAVTRAKKKLFLSYASVRTLFGSRNVNVPSSFLLDLNEDLLEIAEPPEFRGKVIFID